MIYSLLIICIIFSLNILEDHLEKVESKKTVVSFRKFKKIAQIIGLFISFAILAITYVDLNMDNDNLMNTIQLYILHVFPILLVFCILMNSKLNNYITNKKGNNIFIHGFWLGLVLVISKCPWRTFAFSTYLFTLLLGQLLELGIVTISSVEFSEWIMYNRYSLIILMGIDKLSTSFNEEYIQK